MSFVFRNVLVCTIVALAFGGGTPQRAAASQKDAIDFNRDIRPILSDNCFHCHGPDAEKRKADLRLDTEAGAKSLVGGKYPIHPTNPNQGTVLERILSQDPDEQMPPPKSGRHLSETQLNTLRRWITQGAPWQTHWAFIPPRSVSPPSVSNPAWVRNGIDQFILHRLDQEGLAPSPSATPEQLIRRLYLDLTGLPPAPDAVAAYLRDSSEQAYERVVDTLLASPHYGEHLALRWLNAARYADTSGYQSDGERSMWRWRDWVIQQFNANTPFDRMTVEQIAGDLLPDATLAQRIATGFNRNHRGNSEGGIVPEEYAAEYVADRVDTTATVWLGLTLSCARCHDHKYDPITQRDFYSLFAFFNNVPENGRALKLGNSPPFIAAPTEEQERRADQLRARVDSLTQIIRESASDLQLSQSKWEKAPHLIPDPWVPSVPMSFRLNLTNPSQPSISKAVGAIPLGTLSARTCSVFDGKTFIEVPQQGDFDFVDAFAFSVRIHPESANGTVLSKTAETEDSDPSSAQNDGYAVRLENGHLLVTFTKRWLDDALRVRTTAQVPLNQWSHICVSYDGSRSARGVRVFFNGVEQPTETLLDLLNQTFKNTHPLRIGTGGGPSTRFVGGIREVVIHPEALSDEQVQVMSCAESPREIANMDPQQRTVIQSAALRNCFLESGAPAKVREALRHLTESRRALQREIASFPTVMVMEEMPEPRKTHILLRGEYDKPGVQVDAAVPEFLPQLPTNTRPDRLTLARWLVSEENPLTRRVIVNQFWQMIFGNGLVRTPEDFGSQGAPPTHPELLDWLAVEFAKSGWNVKALLRTFVTSATYRQSHRVTKEMLAKDPDNRLLARSPRFRLPAETVRDQALAASGLLTRTIGGPSVKPYQPEGLWQELGGAAYVQDHGEALWRRSLYTFWKRTSNPPVLSTFDASGRESCSVRIARTNTPLQALATMNETAFVEAARKLAERAHAESHESVQDTLRHLFRLVLARNPDDREITLLVRNHDLHLARFDENPKSADSFLSIGESPRNATLHGPELAALTAVANLVLNLDEALCRP
jgi:hypothetical protein